MNVGEAMGRAMAKLILAKSKKPVKKPKPDPNGLSERGL
jgi:hypothetical protein